MADYQGILNALQDANLDVTVEGETLIIEGDDDDGNTLSVNVETLSEAITDPDGVVTYLARTLQSQGSVDQIRIDLENNNAGTLPVEQQSPVALEGDDDDGNTLNPQAETLSEAITDPDGLITYLARTLQSQGSVDQVRVDLENNNAGTITVTDDTNFTTALTDTDPISDTDSGTGSANAAQLDLGSLRKDVDVHVNTSGDATLTVEVSTDASTWREFDTVSYTGGDVRMEQYEVAYRHVRAHLNQNRNLVELASKGTD